MKPVFAAALLPLFLIMSACASGRSPQRETGPAEALQQPGRLLAAARKTQAEKGCAKAIPTYRVVSSFGDGYAIAQYELGACLLIINNTNTTETALFREEAFLWLRRAAWAGNARAQLKLAMLLSGENTQTGIEHSQEEAMGWAIVYGGNPARNLFDLPPVSPHIINHLQAALPSKAMTRAEQFADNFEKITMASFTPPPTERTQGRPQQRPQDGQRRRRRR